MEGLYGGDMGPVRCQAQILLDLMAGASTKSTRSLRAFLATQMPSSLSEDSLLRRPVSTRLFFQNAKLPVP